jgi:hypothetical protein
VAEVGLPGRRRSTPLAAPTAHESTRVYCEVREEPERVAVVKAVGVKDRNRVRIGGEEVDL